MNLGDFSEFLGLTLGTTIVIGGTVVLSIGGVILTRHPIIGAGLLTTGAVLEWIVFASTYKSTEVVRDEVEKAERRIRKHRSEIEEMKDEIVIVESEVEDMRDDVYEHAPSGGGKMWNSIEKRVNNLEDSVGDDARSNKDLDERVSDLEKEISNLNSQSNGSRF